MMTTIWSVGRNDVRVQVPMAGHKARRDDEMGIASEQCQGNCYKSACEDHDAGTAVCGDDRVAH